MASVQKRGKNSWLLVAEVGYDSLGNRIRKTRTVKAKTKREAELELAKFQVEIEAGMYISPNKMTFKDFVQEWEVKYAKKELSQKTLITYNRYLNNRIIPTFGHMRLDEIKPFHIVNFFSDLSEEGSRHDRKAGSLSSSSLLVVYRALRNVLQRAVDWKIISINSAATVKKPRANSKEVKPYDEEEVTKLFMALQNELYHWRMMITIALTTGLRRGELIALEWSHIDLDTGTIDVKQNISVFSNGEPIITEPKTKKSIRKVSLPDSVTQQLRDYYLHCRKEKLRMGDKWENNDRFFVFYNSTTGKPFFPESPYRWFQRFIKRHNLRPIRFHDLRHTSATILINQGVHAKIISERLGHTNISITMNIYGHALRTADKDAANKFDNILPLQKIGDN
ncbi:integrase [Brevibacillus phage Abouo]|uniref:Integrase n=2 Tax=Abouovirus TaxID=1984773 RepID=S5MAF5_9CAUD|nr:integrase [Brevibacillus phage Davies]YP_009220100.1 integrase [Brevibacillus phage Abouo]AGR47480.2 integrase [Brevibacillus phage Abouo]AGR47573.2 integrase [Brevibacillus phage Davies]